MNIWDRLAAVGDQYDVLRHPFYVRWSEGTLSRAELAHYSGQYRHAVVGLATAAGEAARSLHAGEDAGVLAEHAAEEEAHVALWDEFVVAIGGQIDAEAAPQTRECAATWAGDGSRSLPETLAAMFAIESAQPAISATKRDGLVWHYGINATSYFDVHERLDVDHAAQARELIEKRLTDADEDRLVAAAARVLSANWTLLDGVDAALA